jgi:hypothetical protein
MLKVERHHKLVAKASIAMVTKIKDGKIAKFC